MVQPPDEDRRLDLFDGGADTLFGRYRFSVRGPLGRRVSTSAWIAEGVSVQHSPQFRRLMPDGVAVSETHVDTQGSVRVEPSVIQLESHQLSAIATLGGSERSVSVVVEPPHMATVVQVAASSAEWAAMQARVTVDELRTGNTLAVKVPEDVGVPQLQLTIDGEFRQEIRSTRRGRSATAVFDLAKFADAVRQSQRGTLHIVYNDQRIQVARIRPPRYASAIDGSWPTLHLRDYVHVPDLKAAVYLCTAPWRAPVILDVAEDGTIDLPPSHRESGRLLVHLAEEDPWGDTEMPDWPVDEALDYAQGGCYSEPDSEGAALANLLSGDTESLPPGLQSRADHRLWKTFARLEHLLLPPGDRAYVRATLADIIAADPDEAWDSLIRADFEANLTTELTIDSGLAEYSTAANSKPDVIQRLWPRNPMAAALLATTNIVAPTEETAAEIEEIRADMSAYLGPIALQIFDERRDPAREAGRFDGNVKVMSGWTKTRVDAAWRAAQFVPEGMLEADSRLVAARQLFDERKSFRLKNLLDKLPSELRWMTNEIRQYGDSVMRGQLDARFDTGAAQEVWQCLPAASFAYAACARFRAWFPGRLSPLRPRNRELWRMIAAVAPQMVQLDMVLADLMIASTRVRQSAGRQMPLVKTGQVTREELL